MLFRLFLIVEQPITAPAAFLTDRLQLSGVNFDYFLAHRIQLSWNLSLLLFQFLLIYCFWRFTTYIFRNGFKAFFLPFGFQAFLAMWVKPVMPGTL